MTGQTESPLAEQGSDEAWVALHRWDDADAFAAGELRGVAVAHDVEPFGGRAALVWESADGALSYADPFGHSTLDWERARWTSPWTETAFGASELVPSWSVTGPHQAMVTVSLQIRDGGGERSPWFTMAHWAPGDEIVHRTCVLGQSGPFGTVEVDTLVCPAHRPAAAFRVRVDLLRAAGAAEAPVLHGVRVMASRMPDAPPPAVSGPGGAWGTVLAVPPRSQEIHNGHCPQYDGGGQAWAGPACTAMLAAYYGRGPTAAETAWIDPGDPAPDVDFAARAVYDYAYRGCGNWSFNAAYPARYGLHGLVTRLRSLAELERFILAGVPVATAHAFRNAELPGAGYSTAGNIMVVRGFTEGGDPIVNDPLSPDDAAVERVYSRASFERVWLAKGGGVVYLLHPPEVPLPPPPAGVTANW